jgi:RNA polymerase sigma factor (sigma-70 family)
LVAGLDSWTSGYPAEDAVQEALVRAWERTVRGEAVESLAAWVGRVATNLQRDQWRRAKAEERALTRLVLDRPGLLEGLDGTAPADPVAEALVDQVAALPQRQRCVVLLHYFADLPVRVVADRLGVDEGTVKRSLFRARRTLRHALGGAPGGMSHRMERSQRHRSRPGDRARSPAGGTATERRRDVKGWRMAGSLPHHYVHGIAEDETYQGKRVAYLRSKAEEVAGFGTLMQMIDAREYRGQRVRFAAAVRSAQVQGWAGLWMRVDASAGGTHLAFDNMQGRKITGTTGWQRYQVVLDVAEAARAIGLGLLLHSTGEVRVADFRFEPVSKDVPTTGAEVEHAYPAHPQNLDLAED